MMEDFPVDNLDRVFISIKTLKYQLIESVIVFLTIYPLYSVLEYNYDVKHKDIFTALLFLIPILFGVILRNKLKDGRIYGLYFLIITGIIFLLPFTLEQKAFFAISFSFPAFFYLIKLKNPVKLNAYKGWEFCLIAIIISTVGAFSAMFMKDYFIANITVVTSTLIIFFFMMYMYLMRSDSVNNVKRESATVSNKPKKFDVYFLMFIFTLVGFISFILHIIINPINKKIVDALTISPSHPIKANTPEPILDTKLKKFKLPKFLHQKVSHNKEYNFNLPYKLIFGILLLGATILLISLLYKAWKNLKSDKKDEESEMIFSFEEASKNLLDKLSDFGKRITSFANMSNKQKIRRHYQKTITEFKKGGMAIAQHNSPGEINVIVLKDGGKQIDELTAIYEKARYSNEECTDEDYKKIKNTNI